MVIKPEPKQSIEFRLSIKMKISGSIAKNNKRLPLKPIISINLKLA
jgi:hypothetical protein